MDKKTRWLTLGDHRTLLMQNYGAFEIDEHLLHVATGIQITAKQALAILDYPDGTLLFVKQHETSLRPDDILVPWQLYETRPRVEFVTKEVDDE